MTRYSGRQIGFGSTGTHENRTYAVELEIKSIKSLTTAAYPGREVATE
jgi:hypothetical protein